VHPLAKAGSGVAWVLTIALASGTGMPRADARRPGSGQPGDGSRQAADGGRPDPDDPLAARAADFLSWAHPPSEECGGASRIRTRAVADQRFRVDFEIVCRSGRRSLAAILDSREGKGVWQVVEGFEADAAWLDRRLRSGSIRLEAGPSGRTSRGAPVAEITPPPENSGGGRRRSWMPGVEPPEPIEQVRPELPEEAARARLLSDAHVELLVAVSPQGAAERTRPLRGPDPDLGMHGAAAAAILRWRFRPGTAGGAPVRFFVPVTLTFEGLPPEARTWVHRALFHIEAIVAPEPKPVEEALARLAGGERFETVAASLVPAQAQGGDWGFVSATSLPAAVRKALHDLAVGQTTGPIEAEGLWYLAVKRGEIYYAIRSAADPAVSYQVLHEQNAPDGDRLKRIVDADVVDYLADNRRRIYMNEASRRMGIRQKETRIGRLEIHTDALDDEEIEVLGKVIDAALEAHRRFWEPIVPMRPFKEKILVYAFARKQDHERLRGIWDSTSGSPSVPSAAAGEYVASSRLLAISCEETQGHLPVPVLVHEAIHMLDAERIYAAGAQPSKWFEEGLATYFGFSRMTGALQISAGEIRRSGTIVSGEVRMQFDPRSPLREYHRRVAETEPVPLRRLVSAGLSDPLWRGGDSAIGYGAAWTLVHFLEDGARGRRRAAFQDLARLEARGEGGPDAFERIFGPDLDALESEWREYDDRL
jgi:PPIC-type peptidyl-prolyl cis-trans isomerase-like protein/TonB-like protein